MDTDALILLLDIGRKMAETRSLNPLLTYAMEIALGLFKAERGYLVLLNPDGTLDFRVRLDYRGRNISKPEAEISTTILHRVVTLQRPIVTANAIEEPEFAHATSISELQLRSVMAVPLIARSRVIGAVYLENRHQAAVFHKKDLEPLLYFASQAAVCIENALLNEQLEHMMAERAERLRTASETLQHNVLERSKIDLNALHLALEQERTQVISNFIQDASHQFRTPLTVINTNVELLKRKIDKGGLDRHFDTIQEEVNTIVKLVETLNFMVRLESDVQNEHESYDLNRVAHDMLEVKAPLAREKKIKLRLQEAAQPILISGHIEFVRYALGQLLDNALAFTPKAGTALLSVYSKNRANVIEVADNGVGISQEDLPHIFTRFYRTDTAGTTRGFGLGLPIVQRIMQLHEGLVEVESEIGRGSIFRMVFAKDN